MKKKKLTKKKTQNNSIWIKNGKQCEENTPHYIMWAKLLRIKHHRRGWEQNLLQKNWVSSQKKIIRSLQLFFSSIFPRFFDPFLWIICFSKRKIGFLVFTRLNGFNWLFTRKSKLMKLFFFLIESQVFSERNHLKK